MKNRFNPSLMLLVVAALPFLGGCPSYTYGPGGWYRYDWKYRGGGFYHGGNWGRGGWGHGPRWGHWGQFRVAELQPPEQPFDLEMEDLSDPVTLLAEKYGLKQASAEKILQLASQKLEDQKLFLKEFGLSPKDVASLKKWKIPEKTILDQIAAHLGEDSTQVERVIDDFLRDAAKYKSN